MNENVNEGLFTVKNDGTIVRYASMNNEILDTINVSSYSHRVLAAYQARELAYSICKSQYEKANYKDYVEMLMRKDCPKEWEKAEVGRKYRKATRCLIWMPYFFIFIVPIMIILRRKHKTLIK